jgi:hypothetical protein
MGDAPFGKMINFQIKQVNQSVQKIPKSLNESEIGFPVIVNFSNPYILQNDVLSELMSLNSSLKIQLTIITTNYFEPQDLSSSLKLLKKEKAINDFRIIKLYSKIQSPKGRPLQRYLMNVIRYMEVKKIYLQTRPVLSLFHTTNELADLIGIKISKEIGSKIGILRPTSCEIPAEFKVSNNLLNRKKVSLTVLRKVIYTYEILAAALTHILVMKFLNLKDLNSKGFHGRELSDFALCSNLHDAILLEKQLRSKTIDVVNFSPKLRSNSQETSNYIMILLPFLESTKAGDVALSEINNSKLFSLQDTSKCVYIKHHPRTSKKIQTHFEFCFKALYPHNAANPAFISLDYLVENAELIICVGETSATHFAYKQSPEKVLLTRKPIIERYLEPQSTILPTLSEYLQSFLVGMKK